MSDLKQLVERAGWELRNGWVRLIGGGSLMSEAEAQLLVQTALDDERARVAQAVADYTPDPKTFAVPDEAFGYVVPPPSAFNIAGAQHITGEWSGTAATPGTDYTPGPLPAFRDADVQEVYGLLVSEELDIPDGNHWEGYVSRMIAQRHRAEVAREVAAAVAKERERLDYAHQIDMVRATLIASRLTQEQERERCARLVETHDRCGDPVQSWLDLLAAAIRATPKEPT